MRGCLVRLIARVGKLLWLSKVEGGAASLVNSPVVIDGEGKVKLGQRVSFGYSLAPKSGMGTIRIQPRYKASSVCIGSDVELSNSINIIALNRIVIGDGCLIADHVTIFDSDFHDLAPRRRKDLSLRAVSDGDVGEVVVEDNVWICSHAIILKGAVLRSGCVVGAGAVVCGEVPPNTLAAGVPARPVRYIGNEDTDHS